MYTYTDPGSEAGKNNFHISRDQSFSFYTLTSLFLKKSKLGATGMEQQTSLSVSSAEKKKTKKVAEWDDEKRIFYFFLFLSQLLILYAM